MSFPVTRITWIKAKEVPSPEAAQEGLNVYNRADGFMKAYTGREIEDDSTHYLITEWQSREQQEAFFNNPELQNFFKSLQDHTSEFKLYDVPFEPANPEKAFTAPVTALSWVTLRNEEDRLKLKDIFMAMAKGADSTPGAVAWAWGTAIQNPNQYVFAIGWESVEAYEKSANAELAQFTIKEINKLADVEVKHVKLMAHERK